MLKRPGRPSAMDGRGITEGTQRRTKARKEPCPSTKGLPGADRLSALSDELLLQILSFLRIREAISTSSLSRRWRYLYLYLPSLDFSSGAWDDTPAWFIDRVLLLHAAPRIEVFRLSMRFDGVDCSEHRPIDSRLLFAVHRGVRVLDLDIHLAERFDGETRYGLPPCVFHCRTLEDLSVRNCHLRLPSHIPLVSLKKMHLSLIEFEDDELKRLLVGCPLLQSLELKYCNETSDLVIDAGESRKLEELIIVDGRYSYSKPSGTIHICAPNVKYLTFIGAASRRRYEVRDLSSLVAASFDLDQCNIFYEDKADLFTTGLLLRIHQVQVLKLCCWSLQALSIKELQGNLVSALPGVTRLELTVALDGSELQTMFSALHACSKLRTLVLTLVPNSPWHARKMSESDSEPDESDGQYETERPRLLAVDFDILMQDLKTIMIQGLARYAQDHEEECRETEEFVAHKKEEIIVLIGFLLKVSPVLEKMIVRPSKDIHRMARKWELLFKLSSDILSLPRSSPKAQLIIEGGDEAR